MVVSKLNPANASPEYKFKVPDDRGDQLWTEIIVDNDPILLLMISGWAWRVSRNGYVYRMARKPNGGSRAQYLHRLILMLEYGDPREGHHINSNPLDNRRENLQIVDKIENLKNRRRQARDALGRYQNSLDQPTLPAKDNNPRSDTPPQ